MRTAVIGLDSADDRFIDALIAEDRLPNLAAMRSRSRQIPMGTTGPIGRVWESFLLGYDVPEDMHCFDPGRYRTYWLGARPEPPFYAHVPGVRPITFDVPFMSLAAAPEGGHVTAWRGHNPGYVRASQPPELLAELDAAIPFDDSPAQHQEPTWYDLEAIPRSPDALANAMEARTDALIWLQHKFPEWNLLLAVFSETHSATESLWHGVDPAHPLAQTDTASSARSACIRFYEALDRAVGRLVGALPSDCAIVLCSLHGAAGNREDLPATVLLPEMLYQLSFGRPFLRNPPTRNWKANGCAPVQPDPSQAWRDYMWAQTRHPFLYRVRRDARRAVSRVLKRLQPSGDRAVDLRARYRSSTMGSVPAWYWRDWAKMDAFALPTVYKGRVRLNVQGREVRGIVSPRDYRRVRDEIQDVVSRCRDARTGNEVVENVLQADVQDPLQLREDQADLIFVWKGYADAFEHPKLGTIGPFPFKRAGGHSRRGFAWLSGIPGSSGMGSELPMSELPRIITSLLTRDATDI